MEPIKRIQIKNLVQLVFILSGSIALYACSSGGSSTSDGDNTPSTGSLPPPLFQELEDLTLIRGQIVEAELFNIGGGSLTSCVADMPQGFSVSVSANGNTCVINGTAIEATDLESVQITARNRAGEDTITVTYQVEEPTAFVTTWDTEQESGLSANDEITLQTNPDLDYNFTVDWGDGETDEGVTGDITHQYVQPGTYTVTITGVYPAPYFDYDFDAFEDNSDATKLLSVEQWGNRFWSSMENAFVNADNLAINDLSKPSFSQVTSFRMMFLLNDAFDSDVSTWDTSAVTDMTYAFAGSVFDQDVSNWSIDNVTDMTGLFLKGSLSIDNYDRLLLSWSQQSVQPNVTLDVSSRFNPSAESARSTLIDQHGWVISDLNSTVELIPKVDDQAIEFYTGQTFESFLKNSGGEIDECIASGLPEGITVSLSGNSMTCKLNGVPTTVGFSQSVVTATNSFGEDSAIIDFTIAQETPYVTTWKTDNQGSSENDQITLSTSDGTTYNFTVDWGDGSIDENVSETITHTYSTPGTYTLSITGDYPRPSNSDSKKLLTVEQWGQRSWESMDYAFFNTDNLEILATDNPDLSRVDSMEGMFRNAKNFNSDISTWDVSSVTSFNETFMGANAFNQPIGLWDVSSATNMRKMFQNASAFNQDIGDWDVSSVINMRTLFFLAGQFNQDIGDWDVSKVRDMNAVFKNSSFNQDISQWNIKSAQIATEFFENNNDFSTENYDKLLIAWSQNPDLVEDLEIEFGAVQFSADSKVARDILINGFNWSINDGGELPN